MGIVLQRLEIIFLRLRVVVEVIVQIPQDVLGHGQVGTIGFGVLGEQLGTVLQRLQIEFFRFGIVF